VVLRPTIGSNVEVAKSQIFNRTASIVLKFLIAYMLYIRMKMKKIAVKEQV